MMFWGNVVGLNIEKGVVNGIIYVRYLMDSALEYTFYLTSSYVLAGRAVLFALMQKVPKIIKTEKKARTFRGLYAQGHLSLAHQPTCIFCRASAAFNFLIIIALM
ncbi:MAG: hypothetical protein ACNS62_09685 [Candidatus Cyclobacteriaceae bacterium M3_2C_046]